MRKEQCARVQNSQRFAPRLYRRAGGASFPFIVPEKVRGDGAQGDAGVRSGTPVARLAVEPISGKSGPEMTGPYGGRRAFRRSIAAFALRSRVELRSHVGRQVHGVGPRFSRIVG